MTTLNSSSGWLDDLDDPIAIILSDLRLFVWIDYVGLALQSCIGAIGTVLSSGILWVLVHESDRSNFDLIQLNQASCNIIDALIGCGSFIVSRLLLTPYLENGLKFLRASMVF